MQPSRATTAVLLSLYELLGVWEKNSATTTGEQILFGVKFRY
jgi:hypothetical protein